MVKYKEWNTNSISNIPKNVKKYNMVITFSNAIQLT